MDTVTPIAAVVAVILLGIACVQGRDVALAGLQAAGRTLWHNLLLLPVTLPLQSVAKFGTMNLRRQRDVWYYG
jgi:hypothetical protein